MPTIIDEFSAKPIYLQPLSEGAPIGVATGFIVSKNGSSYLVTNWHVVTGRNPTDGLPLFDTWTADPRRLRVWFHGVQLGSWVAHDVELVDDSGRRRWLEHRLGRQVDVVAIPLLTPPDTRVYDIDLALADFDLMIYPSEAVSIIGFPKGLTSAGRLPIWKTGHIASDIDIDWEGKPAFLIDATTKGGMSGSPVIAKRVCIYQTSHGNVIGNAVRFLGVYSGRQIAESGIEVGFVWKPKAIFEVLASQGQ